MLNGSTTDAKNTFNVGSYVVYWNRIGRGVSGTVYKGYNIGKKHKDGTYIEYAIKEIPIDPFKKDEVTSRLNEEISILKKLEHPNIIKYIDHIETKTNIYLILEYCPRGDFYQFQKGKIIQELHVQNYMKQLASGLKYLLDKGVMHRDLKPQNILIADDGTLKITDFGFATIVNKNNMLQTVCGSLLYMAPEIRSRGKYTTKSDLWSVGCIFHEMLTGSPPFMIDRKKGIRGNFDYNINDIKLPSHLPVSDSCKNLLYRLLEPDYKKRITWDDFFDHPWLQKDLLAEEQNKLLDFNIWGSSDEISYTLPSIDTYQKNTRVFYSNSNLQSQDFIMVSEAEKVVNKITKNVEEHQIPPRPLSLSSTSIEDEEIFYSCQLPEEEQKKHDKDIAKDITKDITKDIVENKVTPKHRPPSPEFQIKENWFTDSNELMFSTSLTSERISLNIVETDPYVLINTSPPNTTRSDQSEYKKKEKSKIKKLMTKSVNLGVGFFKSSFDYMSSYNTSL